MRAEAQPPRRGERNTTGVRAEAQPKDASSGEELAQAKVVADAQRTFTRVVIFDDDHVFGAPLAVRLEEDSVAARPDAQTRARRVAHILAVHVHGGGVRVAQRIAAKSVSRWLPVLGALGAGAYAYYDTTHVASNAIDLFAANVRIAEGEPEEQATAVVKPSQRRRVSPTPKPTATKPKTAKTVKPVARSGKTPTRSRRRAAKKSEDARKG